MSETLEDILRDIRTNLEVLVEVQHEMAAGGVSSIAFEGAAKGPPRVNTKSYKSNPLSKDDVDQALETHAYAERQTNAMFMAQWELTLGQLQSQRTGNSFTTAH